MSKRRSVNLTQEAIETIQIYRAKYFEQGVDKSFNEALNELILLHLLHAKKPSGG